MVNKIDVKTSPTSFDPLSIKKERHQDILVSIIVPVYNEEESIDPFLTRIDEVMLSLNVRYEVIFVNDGSLDNQGD